MPLLGQSSGGFTESSSALRILHCGIRNTAGILTDDAFTQTNPPIITTPATISSNVDTSVRGVLSGSVAITRPDQGSNYIGGPGTATIVAASGAGTATTAGAASLPQAYAPIGLFINSAAGNAFENQPAAASGVGPYVSGMGTYASQVFETQALVTTGAQTLGDDFTYITGVPLIASINGYLMPSRVWTGAANASIDLVTCALQSAIVNVAASSTVIGILRMPSDSTQNEIVFDQRI